MYLKFICKGYSIMLSLTILLTIQAGEKHFQPTKIV